MSRPEYTEADIEIGRAIERQLLAEAERCAAAIARKPPLPAAPEKAKQVLKEAV
jgi:hypothetical protein